MGVVIYEGFLECNSTLTLTIVLEVAIWTLLIILNLCLFVGVVSGSLVQKLWCIPVFTTNIGSAWFSLFKLFNFFRKRRLFMKLPVRVFALVLGDVRGALPESALP